ncbi:uncharacterized protein A4U43_C06F13730 [Asparagus officinalis]|uniref:Uncharacterized protein n=1 Tax=Asparagus officinalis TaxID=4686 RepID=A0A5P1EMB8_ASPOF|nr:uncharacterized protein A4U43_C06F13730 [Asparagus officinalis]
MELYLLLVAQIHRFGMLVKATRKTLNNQIMRWISYPAMKMMLTMHNSVAVRWHLELLQLILLRRIMFQSLKTPGSLMTT